MSTKGNFELLKLSNEESNKITKESLQKALIILMENKEFKSITITELVLKAGVSRTAFYRNYNYKEDILNDLLNDTIKQIYKAVITRELSENHYLFWLTIFEKLNGYKNQLYILFKAGMFELIENAIYSYMINEYTNPTSKEQFEERFWSNAICGVLKEWTINKPNESIENLAKYVSNIA